ncbi:hypothetical protein M422DRAFT_248741 [Sphaerobolus stellatus SS14]|nr:hypothetical protein M422DRAFT_248741 [Sphaerobolus stellatus SS14]
MTPTDEPTAQDTNVGSSQDTSPALRVPPTPIKRLCSNFKIDYLEPHLKKLLDDCYHVEDGAYEVTQPANDIMVTASHRRTVDLNPSLRKRRLHGLMLAKEIFGRLRLDPISRTHDVGSSNFWYPRLCTYA